MKAGFMPARRRPRIPVGGWEQIGYRCGMIRIGVDSAGIPTAAAPAGVGG
jgi:hypothetical protein